MAESILTDTPKAKVHITSLPTEILSELPYHLDNLDNLCALLSTSRLFYHVCAGTLARLPVGPNTDVRLIIAGSARRIADWAARSQGNKSQLEAAMDGGDKGLLQLSLSVAPLGMKDLQSMQEAKKSVVEPLAEKLSMQCHSCGVGKFRRKHCMDITSALWDFVTYCELFHSDIRGRFYNDSSASSLGIGLREHWLRKGLCKATNNRNGSPASNGISQRRLWRLRDLCNLHECHGIGQKTYQILEDCLLRHIGPTEKLVWENFHLVSCFMLHQGFSTLKMLLHEQKSDPDDVSQTMDVFRNFGATGKGHDGLNLDFMANFNDWGSLRAEIRSLAHF